MFSKSIIRKKGNFAFLPFLLAIICIGLNSATFAQQTIVVDPSGSGNYTTIQAAFDAINGTTISQAITIRIKPGTYNEHLHLDSIQGTNSTNTITIESYNLDTAGILIYYDSVAVFPAKASFELRKVEYVNIKNLTFREPTEKGYIIGLDNEVGNITFFGNHFYTTNLPRAYPAISLIYNITGVDLDLGNLTLEQNHCESIMLYSRYITLYKLDTTRFINNKIEYSSLNTSNSTPIYSGNVIEIRNNDFINAPIGFISESNDVSVVGNKCISSEACLNFSISNPAAKTAMIANNFFSANRTIAINIGHGDVNVWNNNIFLTDSTYQAFGINCSVGDSVSILNNVIAGRGNQSTGIFMFDTIVPASFECDYNNYYFPQGNISRYFGSLGTQYTTTVAENMQLYKMDSNSVTYNPLYVSDADLHIRNAALKNTGVYLPELQTDIDGDPRNASSPGIGADVISGSVDLIASSFVSFTGNFYPGKTMEIEYQGKNDGDLDLSSLAWKDALYLSSDQTLDANDMKLQTISNNFTVNAGQSYSRKPSVSIPYIAGGTYYFILVVNDQNLSIEDTTNNILVSNSRVLPVPQLPNLVVDTVIVPASIFSGKSFSLTYTIKNIGNASTSGTWSDYIYVSTSQNLLQSNNARIRDSLLKAKVVAPKGLKPNETYTSTRTFSLPIKFSGNVFYSVQANGNKAIFEQDTTFGNNVKLSPALNVIQSPLPDLTVVGLNIQSSAFSGDTISANWTVKNVGQQKTYRTDRFYKAIPSSSNPTMWYDRLVISKNREFDRNDKNNIQKAFYARPINQELDVDSSYTVQKEIVFDRCEYGKFYVFAITNYTNSTFELRYDNNVQLIDSIELILQPNPDLKPIKLEVSNSPASGKQIEINYEVENDGFEDLFMGSFRDRFYLHAGDSLIFNSAINIGATYYNDTLLKAELYEKTPSFNVPYEVYGDYYLSIVTDNDDNVCEAPFENNNVKTIGPFNISLSPQPDLVITHSTLPDTLVPGQNIQVIVETKNQGNEILEQTFWYNFIYLKNSLSNIELKRYRLNPPLNVGESSIDTLNLVVPISASSGIYYLEFHADKTDRVFEHSGEGNNIVQSPFFSVIRDNGSVSDLEVVSVRPLSNNLRAGDLLRVEVKTKNNSRSTRQSGWINRLSLFDNTTFIKEKRYNHLGRINNGETYTDTIEFQLPFDKSGELEMQFSVNEKNNPYEYYTQNNFKDVEISVLAYIPPDLEVTAVGGLNCCSNYALQEDTLKVEVENNGLGNVANQRVVFNVYLSDDQVLDKYDYRLATYQQINSLQAGQSEIVSIPVKYPSTLSGDYFYIVEVDSDDDVYEGMNEDNNKYASGYTIFLQNEITDLALDSISVSSYSGSRDGYVTVNYSFSKPLLDSIDRDWKNSFILSKDKKSQPFVTSFSTQEYSAKLQSGVSSYSESKIISVPTSIEPGYYYIGVLLDRDNVIYESSEENNVLFSTDSFYFDFSISLVLDELKDTFWYERFFSPNVYYNVQRPAGKGMIVDLTVSDKNASTEMYHRAGKIPTNTIYDTKYNNPFLADQEILVSVTDTSVSDYIYLKAAYIPPVYSFLDPLNEIIDEVPYSIIANSAEYSIYSIYPENGGNFGLTSTEIKGFDFDSVTIFYLVNDNKDTIKALSTQVVSSSSAIVTFDLRDYEPGKFSVEAIKGGIVTTLNNAFEVESEGAAEPWVNIDIPDVELTRRSAVMNVNFGNYSNTNGYDYWLVIAISNTKQNVDHLKTSYIGSSEEEMNEALGFTGNPTGDSTHIDIDGIRYFTYWVPNLAAKSQTTFTYLVNHSELDTTLVYALLYRKPMSGFTLSGDFADVGVSATLYDLYDSYSKSVGQRFKAGFDCNNIDINKVQQELGNQTIKLAEHVHGGVTAYSGARSGRDMVKISYEQWKGDVKKIGESETQQKMLQEMILKDKSWVDVAGDFFKSIDPRTNTQERFYKKEPPFSDLINDVFKCLDTDPEFQKNIDRCIVAGSHPKYGTTYYNICKKKPAENEDNFVTRWIKSFDPNEIVGPKGITDLQYVNKGDKMPYIILFENKSIATAPAVTVKINNPLDTSFRLQSFKLTEFGFGDTSISLSGENNINQIIELGPKYNNQKLHIVAGLDLVNNQAIWRITTIDPVTGNPIMDPFGGFLPPNDSTGRGEGYVKYEIDLKSNARSGSVVTNQADIIFDQNEIIPTNIWENIVISSNPESAVVNLPSLSPPTFEVSWSGSDGDFGPGIQSYSVYVSKNDGAYEEWISNATDTSAFFSGEVNAEYKFYSILHLLDGNSEAVPVSYDAKTTVKNVGVTTLIETVELLVYPNPGSSILYIDQEKARPMEVRIVSIDGRVMDEHMLQGSKNSIDTNHLPAGFYVIECYQGNKRTVVRWIKN